MAVDKQLEIATQSASRRTGVDRFAIAAVVLFAVVRCAAVIGRPVVEFIDTDGYRDVSFIGNAYRPWGYPLVLWFAGGPGSVATIQVVVGIASFTLLAVTIAGQIDNPPVRRSILVLVLLIGVHPRTTGWDLALLTESLTISLTCVLLAAWIKSADNRRWAWVFAVTFVFWLFLRDAHVFLAIPVVAFGVWRWRQSALSATLVMATLWAGWVSVSDQRIEIGNALANVGWHAPEDGATEWFIDRGMPKPELFNDLIAWGRIRAMWESDEARTWLEDEGAGIWVEYLLTHPSRLIAPATEWTSLNDPVQFTDPRDPLSIRSRWPGPHRIMAMSTLGAALAVLLAVRSAGWDRRLGTPLFLLASVVPHHFMVSHAVPIETPRHGMLMTLTLVLGIIWVTSLSVNALLAGRRDGPRKRSETPLGCEIGTQRRALVGRECSVEGEDLSDRADETIG